MPRFPPFLVPVAIVGLLVAGGAWLAVDNSPYALKVGDREVSQSSVDDELRALTDSDELAALLSQGGGQSISLSPGSVTSDLGASWVGLLVAQHLADVEVARRDLPVTDADRQTGHELALQSVGGARVFRSLPDWFRERLDRRWTSVAVLERALLAEPTPALVEAAASQCPSGRYVSHILVETGEEAAAIKTELDAGRDFAELARTRSVDTGSSDLGGALGCLDGLANAVEPFLTAATNQPVGVVSDPVQSEFGFHLILVTDQPTGAELEQVAVDEILREITAGKNVRIDPRYGRWDRANGQVLPPDAPEPNG